MDYHPDHISILRILLPSVTICIMMLSGCSAAETAEQSPMTQEYETSSSAASCDDTVTKPETEASAETTSSVEETAEQASYQQLDVIFIASGQPSSGYLWPVWDGHLNISISDIRRYEEVKDAHQLFAFKTMLYDVHHKFKEFDQESGYVTTDHRELWIEICRECGFIPYFPDIIETIPASENIYTFCFLSEIEQVKALGTDLVANDTFTLEISDMLAPPDTKNADGEKLVHLTVSVPEEYLPYH